MKVKIGTGTFDNYSATRNITDLPFQKYEFKKLFSWYKIPSYAYYKLLKKGYLRTEFNFNDNYIHPDIPLRHFFNLVSDGRGAWMTSFESYIPYWETGKKFRKDLELLTRDSCKHIIPISRYARGVCEAQIQKFNPAIWNEVNAKMTVIHPSQKRVFHSFEEKEASKNFLHLVLVGSFFFNKGGLPLVQAVDALLKEKFPIKLTIVSSMTYHVWNVTHATDEDFRETMRIIDRNAGSIVLHRKLPNADVLSLMKSANVGLLPSLGDTYGYSVLELMSCGCPVITTDAFVFPEINSPDRGWLIEVPKNQINGPLLTNASEREHALRTIRDQLYTILKDCCHKQAELRTMGRNAWEYVTANHSVEKNTAMIEKIYDDILGL